MVNNTCASSLYFFHPDHLGSSSFLSDETGQAYQFLLYLPWGESMAEQKAGGWTTPYKYTGKELDTEIGLYDYGARFYDPAIGIFPSIDRFAEKFHYQSPYTFAANNPIKYIDVNGDSIRIADNSYREQTLEDLGKIYATKRGKRIVDRLMNSEKVYTIDGGTWLDPKYNGYFREVNYKQKDLKKDGVTSPSYVVLAHELYHAYQHDTRGAEHRRTSWRQGEAEAVRFGNYIRELYGKGFRSRYSGLGTVAKWNKRLPTGGQKLNESQISIGPNTKVGDNRFFGGYLQHIEVLENGGCLLECGKLSSPNK